MLKYLRIAVTALSLMVCVLIVALRIVVMPEDQRLDPFDWGVAAFDLLFVIVFVIPFMQGMRWRYTVRTLLIATTLVACCWG